jgi:hypothetical protein
MTSLRHSAFDSCRAAALALVAALACGFAGAGEIAEADAARKKPLQRCDQMSDKAEIACLQKAREGIVAARQKREASGKDKGAAAKTDAAPDPKGTQKQ